MRIAGVTTAIRCARASADARCNFLDQNSRHFVGLNSSSFILCTSAARFSRNAKPPCWRNARRWQIMLIYNNSQSYRIFQARCEYREVIIHIRIYILVFFFTFLSVFSFKSSQYIINEKYWTDGLNYKYSISNQWNLLENQLMVVTLSQSMIFLEYILYYIILLYMKYILSNQHKRYKKNIQRFWFVKLIY